MTTDNALSRLGEYRSILLKYNEITNVISRRITDKKLDSLIRDSCCLGKYIRNDRVIDMGSGNGILGIPLAILYPGKCFNLVDSAAKKIEFLRHVKKNMKLINVQIIQSDILGLVRNRVEEVVTIISRGYTGRPVLRQLLGNPFVQQILLITSVNKVEIIGKDLDNCKKTVYNMDSRDVIKILSLESVSRETKK